MKKYLISAAAKLHFADGRQVELAPGIHEHPDDVASHWAFSHYATLLNPEPASEEPEVVEPHGEPEEETKGQGNAKK